MNFLVNMEEIVTSSLERLGLAWWIEIVTDKPHCTYYFGPFVTSQEAQQNKSGYIQDLEEEEAGITNVTIKQFKPKELTIFDNENLERYC